jgi:amino acid adenylation domain-containing protein
VGRVQEESEKTHELGTAMPWRAEYLREATVHGLFVETALTNPDAVALVSEGESITYAALLARAQGIAASLRRRGVGAGTMVGLAVERSPATIASILGILISGGVYVPLELKGSPAHLLQRQVRSSGISLLLTDRSFQTRDWPQPWWRGCELLPVSQLENELLPAGSDFVPAKGLATDPAYVMFTSGSTGQPKGVIVPHRGIVRLVSAQDYLRFGPDETFLLHSPLGFDASTLEIWGSLLHGGRLAIAPAGAIAVDGYERLVSRYEVTTLWLTASVFHLVADHAPETFGSLNQLIVGGDVVSPQRVEQTLRNHPKLQLVNGYGPTENTTFTACYRVPPSYKAAGSLPIGKPIHGTQVYVLDADRQLVADGEVGELAAGGDGVALGYLDAPEVTASRFIPDPFSGNPEARLYLTGDKVRWNAGGNLEFLGRVDQEIKVAGRRIDLKELEETLAAHPLVQQAAIVVSRDDLEEKRLYAFVQLQQRVSGAPAALRDFLSGCVPAAAVPARIVELESLPLNANGKIDREKLLNSLNEKVTAGGESVGEKEENSGPDGGETDGVEVILGVWKHLLRVDGIGLDENFFDVGGTSLLLLELHIELSKRFPGKLSLMDLFSATTVRKMSQRLQSVRIGYENATLAQDKARAH